MASSVAQPLERQFADLPGVNQITSSNVQGTTSITLVFDLSRNIDGAAADVQAAINAASGVLPKQLPNPPTYKKVNPADQPVLILGLTSDLMTLHQLDQYADLNLAQRISMLPDVGQVVIFGQQKYAPTIQLNPTALAARRIAIDDVATAVGNNTVERPGRHPTGSATSVADRRQQPASASEPAEQSDCRLSQRRSGTYPGLGPSGRRIRRSAAGRLGQQSSR
jgi:multidrug efflux pump subunit AcrB